MLDPHNHVADWTWGLLPLRSILREYHTAYRQPGKGPKFKTRITVSTESKLLLHHHKIKDHKLTILSWRLSVICNCSFEILFGLFQILMFYIYIYTWIDIHLYMYTVYYQYLLFCFDHLKLCYYPFLSWCQKLWCIISIFELVWSVFENVLWLLKKKFLLHQIYTYVKWP